MPRFVAGHIRGNLVAISVANAIRARLRHRSLKATTREELDNDAEELKAFDPRRKEDVRHHFQFIILA